MKRVYLVMNFRTDNHFLLNAIRKRGNQVRVNGIPSRLRVLAHYNHFGKLLWNSLKVVRSLFAAFRVKSNETVIVLDDTASGVFTSIFLQLFNKSNSIVLLNMIDNLSGSTLKKELYGKAFKRLYCSVNNEELAELYHNLYAIPIKRFFIQPDTIDNFGMRILKSNESHEDRGYIFTGGNSYRDWNLFLKVVNSLPQYKFVGVAAKPAFPKVEIPHNLKMFFDIPEEEFLSLLRHCRIGYIPINVKTQGGQIVVYQLSLYHKPVVTTDSYAIKSVITNGYNGILVKIHDVKDSISAISSLMESRELRQTMGNRIFNDVSKLTTDYFCNILFNFMKSKNIEI